MSAGMPPPTSQPASGGGLSVRPLTVGTGVVLTLVGVLALREIASLIVPILFGLFIALVAAPLIDRLERRGVRPALALAYALLVVVVVVLVTAAIIAFSIGELVLEIPRYQTRLTDLLETIQDLAAEFGIELDLAAITAVISAEEIVSWIRPVASAVGGATAGVLILLFTMIYALSGARSLQARAEATIRLDHPLFAGVERFGSDLRRYLLVRAQLGVFAAVLVLILLVVLGVPFAPLWAFLVFAASFIPNIGTFIALVPPTILGLLDGGIGTAVAVVIGFTLVNFAQDYLLQPRLMGNELNLSPLVVFVSVIAWAWILGAAGALLAVPLTVGLVAVLEAWPSSRPIAVLMRNKLDEPTLSSPPDSAPAAGTDEDPSAFA